MPACKKHFLIAVSVILFAASFARADGDADPADPDSYVEPQSVTEPPQVNPPAQVASSSGKKFGVNYYGIFYGPSLQDGGILQPSPDGLADPSHPVQVKNFVGATYNLNDAISITPTAFFVWTPVHGQKMTMMDPFIRIGDNQIINTDEINLYADVRVHFPVTAQSQQNNLQIGVQSFQALTYLPQGSRFNAALYTSVRLNRYGKLGLGNDLELYAAPMVAYQLSSKVSLTMLYEMGASHAYGMPSFQLNNDGTDLEPGVTWDITQSLTVNPYVNLYPGQQMSLRTSSLGMTLSWNML